MATITLTLGSAAADVSRERAFVYVKSRWANTWTYVPYIHPQRSEQAAAPTVDTATFRYDYGRIQRAGTIGYSVYTPLELEGWYIAIWVHGRYQRFLSFCGVVSESVLASIGTAGTVTGGNQLIGAHGLDGLLDRGRVQGSYIWEASGDGYVDRTIVFNRRNSQGQTDFGNRSENVNGDGVYMFSKDGYAWSNLDIIDYLMHYFQPGGVTFRLFGALDVLDTMHYELNPDGLSLRDCLDRLIDRRRGLGWTVDPVAGGEVTIFVFTTLSYPVQFGDFYMPANYRRVNLWNTSDVATDTQLVLRPAHNYSRIIVRGARVKTTMSFAYSNGTLEEGWTVDDRVAYEAETEENRTDDAFRRVFAYHRVPDDFDYTYNSLYDDSPCFANPALQLDGTLDLTQQTSEWGLDAPFDSYLPYRYVTDGAPADNPYRPAFVLLAVDETDGEGAVVGDYYGYSNQMQNATKDYLRRIEDQGAGVSDVERAFWLHLRRQYHLGKGVYTPQATDDSEPFYEYDKMVATATVPMDTHSKVIYEVPGHWDSETSRELLVTRDDVEFIYVAPGTVSGVVDGSLVFDNNGAGYVIRDDTYELRAIAGASAGWYGQQRNTVSLRRTFMSPALPVGMLVLSAASSAFYRRSVGTVVTNRRFDYTTFTTEVQTGFAELDLGGDD